MAKKDPSIVTSQFLKKQFGDHAAAVLAQSLTRLERKKGETQRYKIINPLPSKDEFIVLRNNRYTFALTALINDSWAELESLKDEIQSWYDNLPESFQNGEKGDALQDVINTFDNCSEPTAPEEDSALGKLKIICIPAVDVKSRAARLDEVVKQFQACIDELNKLAAMKPEDRPEGIGDDLGTELKDELEAIINEINDIEFPGAFG